MGKKQRRQRLSFGEWLVAFFVAKKVVDRKRPTMKQRIKDSSGA